MTPSALHQHYGGKHPAPRRGSDAIAGANKNGVAAGIADQLAEIGVAPAASTERRDDDARRARGVNRERIRRGGDDH